MSALALPLAFALPIGAGWLLVGWFGHGLGRGAAEWSLRAGLSVVLGLGAAALFAYGWLVLGGSLDGRYAAAESAAFLGIGAALMGRSPRAEGAPPPASGVERVAVWLAAVGALLLIIAFAVDASAFPHGDWDAWAIWNQRARFLLRGGANWRAAFSPELEYSHTGYPLLVPAAVARVWAFAGESILAPVVIAALFTLAPVLVVFGAVTRCSGAVAGASASLFLIATEAWRTWGASQYADVPLAAMAACTAAVLTTGVGGALPTARSLALAGSFLGLAAWTKDEGLAIAAVFSVWVAVRSGRASLRSLALLLAGAAPPLLARLHFQTTVSPAIAAVFTEGQTAASALDRLLDPQRWITILKLVPGSFPGLVSGLALVAVAAAWALGARPRAVLRSLTILPVFGVYSAYLVAYAVTPLSLEWHIQESARRVLLQPWPALLIGLMALAPAPVDASGTAEAGEGRPGPGATPGSSAAAPP